MKIFSTVMASVLISILASCASIPPEAVTLNAEVSVGVNKMYLSQISLVNLYFETQQTSLDKASESAIDRYFSIITPSDDTEISFSGVQLEDISGDVVALVEKSNAAKAELEKIRIKIIKDLETNYLNINSGITTVSGLLQSAVSVKEASSEAYSKLNAATGGAIDLEQIFTSLDSIVADAGDNIESAEATLQKLEALSN